MANVLTDSGLQRALVAVGNDITHVAVGDDNTVHVITNTTLGNETNRLAPTNRLYAGFEGQIRTFFPIASLPTTVEEIGAFLNGTGAADSGSPLVLANLTFTKGTQDLFLIVKVNIQRGS